MAYASHCNHADFVAAPARTAPVPRKGLLRRMFDAVTESRRRHAERDIARYLASTGGRITDDIERRITERISTGEWNRHD